MKGCLFSTANRVDRKTQLFVYAHTENCNFSFFESFMKGNRRAEMFFFREILFTKKAGDFYTYIYYIQKFS